MYKSMLHRAKARSSERADQDFFLPYNVYDVNVYAMVEEYRQVTSGTGPMWHRNGSDSMLRHGNVAAMTKRVASFLNLSGNYMDMDCEPPEQPEWPITGLQNSS